MFLTRKPAALAAGVCLALGAAGTVGVSAGSAATAHKSSKPKLTKLTVGSTSALQNVGLYLGTENGGFAKNGLSVKPVVVTSGQQAVPELLHGQIQFTAADPLGAIEAIKAHIPLEIVAPGGIVSPNPKDDDTGLLVNSSITSISQLNGKTIAVNAIGGFAQLAAEASIDKEGGSASSIKWVELGLPQMIAAVQSGQVDGAVEAEPFVSAGKAAGLKDLLGVSAESMAGVPQIVYVTSTAYAKSHPQIVKAFVKSIYADNAALSKSPSLIAKVGVKSTQTSASQIKQTVLPSFSAKHLTLGAMSVLLQQMTKYNILTSPINLTPYLYEYKG